MPDPSQLNPLQIYGAVLPVFIVVGIGLFLRWRGIVKPEADKWLLKLVVNLLMPCLILDKMIGNPSLRDIKLIAVSAGTGYLLVSCGMLLALGVGKMVGMKRGAGLRSFGLGTGVQNYGYVAIPVLLAVFVGADLGVLFTHSLGVELAIWTVGMMVLTGETRFSWRRILSGPVVAIIIGLSLSWTGLGEFVPETVHYTIGWLGQCGIPMSLLLVGMTIADLAGNAEWSVKVPVAGGLLRLGVLPFGYIAAAYLVRDWTPLAQVFVVQAAMPAGNFPIVLARHFGGQPDVPTQVMLASTVGSVLTMPLWVSFGVWVIGM
ncbi:AEC family transporter [Sulfuriroseicoccus oceanibius]|uniref:AEC family transporter n=1 Tax=Sulfuriroseicoccus oceanibius TaxID=2707525 RepID=A0A6B3LEQ7_9BACT|nr:AEC family transporter [Sulfuriroseicoccus oceanibius]QQL44997.1 AEC family transporter [Sulfuriroseicoccus oceanibius]